MNAMKKNPKLNGRIHEKYDSEADCAKAMGWHRQKLNRLLRGESEPTWQDVIDLAMALDMSVEDFRPIFLPAESTNVDGLQGSV